MAEKDKTSKEALTQTKVAFAFKLIQNKYFWIALIVLFAIGMVTGNGLNLFGYEILKPTQDNSQFNTQMDALNGRVSDLETRLDTLDESFKKDHQITIQLEANDGLSNSQINSLFGMLEWQRK